MGAVERLRALTGSPRITVGCDHDHQAKYGDGWSWRCTRCDAHGEECWSASSARINGGQHDCLFLPLLLDVAEAAHQYRVSPRPAALQRINETLAALEAGVPE